jgi:hypothetical protein
VGDNGLTGVIPPGIENIPDLYFLNLSHNELWGPIPAQFANLQTLSIFDFSYNNLSGPVPLFDSYNVSVFEGNPLLCGALLSRACPNTGPTSAHHPKRRHDPNLLAWLVGALFSAAVIVLLAGMCCFLRKYRSHIFKYLHRESVKRPWKLTAFQRLDFSAAEVLTYHSHNIISKWLHSVIFTGKRVNSFWHDFSRILCWIQIRVILLSLVWFCFFFPGTELLGRRQRDWEGRCRNGVQGGHAKRRDSGCEEAGRRRKGRLTRPRILSRDSNSGKDSPPQYSSSLGVLLKP